MKMKKHQFDGVLITFCGLDGCGKTTLLTRLCQEPIIAEKLFLTKQPTPAVRKSRIFRSYMDSPDHNQFDYRSLSLLAASDRIQHTAKVISPELEKGKIVISDRYFFSCIANLRARGYNKDRWIEEIASIIIKPDLSFFLDVDVKTALERVRSRPEEKERYIDVALQFRLREQYLKICKKTGGVLVPTNISPDESYSIVLSHVKRLLKERKNV